MRRPSLRGPLVALTGLVTGLVVAVPPTAPPAVAADDVPDGAPAAVRAAEPRLPVPDGWPFAQELSRTGGTGRLHGGASYWTDFVYDDHGAAVPGGMNLPGTSSLAPAQGVYQYADPAAHGNGADVFVAAVGATARASYWRVDWNTLADPDVPIAVWTFDTDRDRSTGITRWPADAGVESPGMEQALVVSSRGAWLLDLVDETRRNVSDGLTVDRRARSFVVRVPQGLLPADGRWRVRLAAGVAGEDGRTMAAPTVPPGTTSSGGLPHVHNLAFRTNRQEPPVHRDGMTSALAAGLQAVAEDAPLLSRVGADGLPRFVTGNFWRDDNQADTLAQGDVSRFSHVVRWERLRRKARTPEPYVRGYSNRWYVSGLELGQGVVEDGEPGAGDGRPNFLGRVQPYAVYVPRAYDRDLAKPLTWVLHSLGVNHNQYGALNPRLLQQLCEDRGSICATTLGHGPDGWYFDEAEVDYWSVWRELAQAYRLDERRTVITGYSMGGWATYQLGLSHPDLYAEAVSLAGPPTCGVTLDGDRAGGAGIDGRCTTDGRSGPLVGNALHVPWRIAHGNLDQLVPFTSVEAQVARFDGLGLRHRFLRLPEEDHMAFAVQDRFDTVIDGLGHPRAVRDPRVVDFTWRPHLTRPGLGIGATTAYWVTDLAARDDAPGSFARIRATSHGIAERDHDVARTGPAPVFEPLPGLLSTLGWDLTDRLDTRRRLDLDLTNAARVEVDMRRADLRCGRVRVATDGRTTLVLRRLPDGSRTFRLDEGEHRLRVPC